MTTQYSDQGQQYNSIILLQTGTQKTSVFSAREVALPHLVVSPTPHLSLRPLSKLTPRSFDAAPFIPR